MVLGGRAAQYHVQTIVSRLARFDTIDSHQLLPGLQPALGGGADEEEPCRDREERRTASARECAGLIIRRRVPIMFSRSFFFLLFRVEKKNTIDYYR